MADPGDGPGPPPPPPPHYFSTKPRPEGPKKIFGRLGPPFSQGLDNPPPSPPLSDGLDLTL